MGIRRRGVASVGDQRLPADFKPALAAADRQLRTDAHFARTASAGSETSGGDAGTGNSADLFNENGATLRGSASRKTRTRKAQGRGLRASSFFPRFKSAALGFRCERYRSSRDQVAARD